MISVQLNGKARTFDSALAIPDLLRALEVNPRTVAVAINGEVVPKTSFATTTVRDGDAVEIVRMVGGG
jgi:thiamine biosynthesis protein ThiS